MSTQFTAMTWNVENLFPPGHRISPQKVVAEADYHGKLAYLAERTLEVKPDVLALQEVGSRNADDTQSLDDLQDVLGGEYPFRAVSKHSDDRGIRVAFLSRAEILQAADWIDFVSGELSSVPDWHPHPPITQMGRGALQIEIEPAAGVRLRLITVHLKSKLISYPAAGGGTRFSPKDESERTRGQGLALLRRTAEAVTVRSNLNDLMSSAPVMPTIVLGDFNDEPRAATSQLILGPEDADATTDDKLDPVRLYNLLDAIPRRGDASNDKRFLPEEQGFTRLYRGRRELIDHILVSKSLLGESPAMRQDQWRVVEVRSLVDSILGQDVGDNPADRSGEHRPDHAPVYARFDLG